jgi:hypothetical protein
MAEPIALDGRQDENRQAVTATPEVAAPAGWSLAHRIGFRFVFAYLALYCLPFPLGNVPGTERAAEIFVNLQKTLVPWVGKHVLHLAQPIVYQPTGSGDTMADYVWALCLLALAALAVLVWTLLDRRRLEYRGLHRWLRLYVRYWLAWILLSYGMAKVIKTQFPTPAPDRLEEPLGQFSPMGLLWTFMGYSTPYTFFAGGMEALGGILLFFRRTTTLGSLVTLAVIGNVVLLNFCYDVPVKLFSLHLLLAAVFLAAPDARRLACVLVLNRSAAPVSFDPYWRARWARIGQVALKVLVVGWALYSNTSENLEAYRSLNPTGADVPPIFGSYEVEEFVRAGKAVPPVATDASRWSQMSSFGAHLLRVKSMAGPKLLFNATYSRNTLILSKFGTVGQAGAFTWSRPDPQHIFLQGTFDKLPLAVKLREIPARRYPLMTRGFHWIQEFPFNR